MKYWNLAGSTAAIALMSGTGAFADVTPEQVWQNWQDMSASYGQTMTATSATRSGDTLVVEGLEVKTDEDGFVMQGTIETVNFRDKGDGSVEITMSDSYPLTLTLPPKADEEGAKPTDLTIAISQPGMMMTASGTPEATSYDYSAPSATVKLEAIEGVDADKVDATVEATLTNLKGKYLVDGDETARKVTSGLSIGGMALAVIANDAETDSDVRITANIADIATSSESNLLGPDSMVDLAKALADGMTIKGLFSHGATEFDISVTESDKPTTIKGSAASGTMNLEMDASHFAYGVGSKGVAIAISSPDIPVPEVKATYDETSFSMLMPVGKTAAPADAGLMMRIVGLAVSDEIWGMIDPAGSLPHDPATVALDTKGTVTMTSNLFDEAEMAALGEAPPGQINSLDLLELKASAIGAELTGSGALTFDNTDTTTFEGIPTPTGTLDFKLVGANALMDKLKTMGLVSDDDLMGARMMMGMFANATGEDELSSRVEFKDKGLFVNGQKMQ